METTLSRQLRDRITGAVAGFQHGWCTPEKALAMATLIAQKLPKVCVEIGVYSGRSLVPQAMVLQAVNHGVIYGIDPWKKSHASEGNCSEADKEWWDSVDLHAIHNYCMDKIWEQALDGHCVIVRAASHFCAQLFNTIDILHIDGCHSEESSCRDVNLYLPKVMRGGHIWIDDTDWATTAKAQAMLANACEKVSQVGTCALYRKK